MTRTTRRSALPTDRTSTSTRTSTRSRSRTLAGAIGTCAALALGASLALPAAAAPPPAAPDVEAQGLLSPLSLAVRPNGTVLVSQNFAGLMSSVKTQGAAAGTVTRVGTQLEPGAELGALSVTPSGRVTYAESRETSAVVKERNVWGGTKTVADTWAAEVAFDPDGDTEYGLLEVDEACAAQVPAEVGGATSTGETYSHPYATTTVRDVLYVADAGANTIWKVQGGQVTPLAALPPQAAVLPDEAYAAFGFPSCAFGTPYSFEAVPTDVEVGPDGWLYVSTLPGGPEDPSLGARGSVWRVHPATGELRLVATGFAGATNLAVSGSGDVYVAELFGGRVSVVARGTSTPTTAVEVPFPGAVEVVGKDLWVTTDVLSGLEPGSTPAGSVVRVPLG